MDCLAFIANSDKERPCSRASGAVDSCLEGNSAISGCSAIESSVSNSVVQTFSLTDPDTSAGFT